jgi:UDP-N-acetylmuramyl pentapeptide phosphotransferase/UDP-N-acetylglucosamine-1-phosphate transferase
VTELSAVPAWGVSGVVAAVLSAAVAGLWWRHARQHVLDLPDERRLHHVPTARGGGLGIAVVLLLASAWLGPGAAAFALGLALTAGAGFVDDLRPLPAAAKLAGQALGALPPALAWPLMPELFGPLGGIVAAWGLVLALVNIWNFMDGSNGLAATQALLFGAVLALLAGAATPVGWGGVVLAGGALGFLPWNLPRARLFLGDVGSHALGYGVAVLSLMALADATGVQAWQLLLLASAFLLDAGLTLLGRLARGEKVWRAHREHLYQRAIAHGHGHGRACLAYAAWTLAAAVLAVLLAGAPPFVAWTATCAWLVSGIMGYWLGGRRWPRPATGPGKEA